MYIISIDENALIQVTCFHMTLINLNKTLYLLKFKSTDEIDFITE